MLFVVPSYLRDLIKYEWSRIENISLKLDKFAPFDEDKKDSSIYKPRIDRMDKKIILKPMVIKQYREFYELQESLWKSKLEGYVDDPENFLRCLRLKTKSRLVIGLGDESVYETSIRLHRNYGVPYIPGSALKGVTKHYAIYRLVDENYETLRDKLKKGDFFELAENVQKLIEEPDDSKVSDFKSLSFNLKDEQITLEDLRKIFGTQKYEGSIIFFDAFPTPDNFNQKPVLELDIMNPHYQPYYSASDNELQKSVEKAPGDWHSPNPIFFLTVPAGIAFQFAIAPRNSDNELLSKAKALLESALEEFGVGAKTSLGYGRFENEND